MGHPSGAFIDIFKKKLLGEKQVKDVSSCMVCAYSMRTMRYTCDVARCGSETPAPRAAPARGRAHSAQRCTFKHIMWRWRCWCEMTDGDGREAMAGTKLIHTIKASTPPARHGSVLP